MDDMDEVTIPAYMRLAAAIVRSGNCDENFKESEWCHFLTETVNDYAQNKTRNDSNIQRIPHGSGKGDLYEK